MSDEAAKADARARRRASEAKNRKSPIASPLALEPSAYLEALRTDLMRRLVEIADSTDDEGLEASICLRLLGLSSLGRQKVELTAELAKAEVPDLSMLSGEQLIEIIKLAETMKGPITIEIPERAAGNGHASGTEEPAPS